MNLSIIPTNIEDLIVINPKTYFDHRGCYLETYSYYKYQKVCNFVQNEYFVQDSVSISDMGVLRGLHFQKNNPQAKLVSVLKGKVYDVAVDLRENSKTYGKYYGIYLDGISKRQMFIPKGFAHGFLSLEKDTIFSYKSSDFYDPTDESGLAWNDPDLDIKWPVKYVQEVILSEKDKNWPRFRQ